MASSPNVSCYQGKKSVLTNPQNLSDEYYRNVLEYVWGFVGFFFFFFVKVGVERKEYFSLGCLRDVGT